MTFVPEQETDPRIAKGKAAEQVPLAGHKKVGRRLSLLCPWINQTKPRRQKSATGVVFIRRGWSYVCSTLAITLALLGTPLQAQFVYVANLGGSNVLGYTINPVTGALTPIAGSPFAAGGGPTSVTVDPNGKFAYVANFGGVSGYTINPVTGALTPIAGSPFGAELGQKSIVSDPNGKFVYVVNVGFADENGHVSGYTINPATGALTSIVGSPFPAGLVPLSAAVDSRGKFIYCRTRTTLTFLATQSMRPLGR
jgi:hypothetical protein